MEGNNFKDDRDVWHNLRDLGFDLSDSERDDMNAVVINTELREMPGEPPMRRHVQVPISRLPGLNSILLRLVSTLIEFEEVASELVVDPKYVRELEDEIVHLQQQLEIYRGREREWRGMSVLRKLWRVLSTGTTRPRLTDGGGSERKGPVSQ